MCQHLVEGQILTTTDFSNFSLAEVYKRELGRVEFVEIFKCLKFFLMLVKERIWSINVNLMNFSLCGWITAGTSIN